MDTGKHYVLKELLIDEDEVKNNKPGKHIDKSDEPTIMSKVKTH